MARKKPLAKVRMPYNARSKRSRRPMGKTRKNRSAKKVSTVVKQYVKKALHAQAENKVWISYATNQPIVTTVAGNPTSLSLCPQPAQGVSQFQRIGAKVKIVKGFIRGHVNMLPYSATTNPWTGPVYVKMWLCKNKLRNTASISDTNISINFFDSASGSTGMQGNMLDLELTNNKDDWIVYATKTFELNLTSNASGSFSNTSAPDNSRYSRSFYFSFGKHLRKQLNYEGTGAANPTNANLFLVFQAVNADGSSSAVQCAEYHFNTRVEFEDI